MKTKKYKRYPVFNGYHIKSEMNDVLKSGYYESPLVYDNVDWFVNEVMKEEKKLVFFLKNTKKHINMTDEDEELYSKTKT